MKHILSGAVFLIVGGFGIAAVSAQEAETPETETAAQEAEATAATTEAAAASATANEPASEEATDAADDTADAAPAAADEAAPAQTAAAAPVSASGSVAIMNGTVHTISGAAIENGDVIIRDGRIAAVGANLEAPLGAEVIDATGKIVTPGLFAPISSIGLQELGLDREANDAGPRTGFPLGAALDAQDAFDPSTTLIAINRTGGITRGLSAPEAGDTLFGGRAAVIDFSGEASSITKPRAAQTAEMGYAGARRAGDTRMGAWAVLREYLDETAAYAANPTGYLTRAREDRFAIADLKALAPVVRGTQPLLVSVNSAPDIRNLIRLKNAYRLNVIIVGGSEAWTVADELAAANIPVILDPLFNLPAQFEDIAATQAAAGRLHEAGVDIAFYNPQGFGAHNLRALPQLAGNAVAYGLDYDAALEALTLTPAEMFGLSSQLGSIEIGKIADIVIWDGDPLELTTRPEAVFINGEAQSLENRQTKLRDRYRDLTRGDLPHAYRGGQ